MSKNFKKKFKFGNHYFFPFPTSFALPRLLLFYFRPKLRTWMRLVVCKNLVLLVHTQNESHTMLKSMKNCARKWCQKLFALPLVLLERL